MLPGNAGVDGEEIVDGFAGLEKVEERLHRYPGMGKARDAMQDLSIDGHYVG
jgi:hypothetical protein